MADLPELESSGLSLVGPVREDNQDAVCLPEPYRQAEKGYLFGLADGMGGYANGAQASRLALETLFSTFYASNGSPARAFLKQGVENANLAVVKAAQQNGEGRMGTTLTAAFFGGSSLHLAHVGDSRAYLLRGDKVTCLTSDHTTVGDLVRMKVIPPGRVRSHPQRSILNRAVGLGLFITPELSETRLKEGDRLVLCSDGLWSFIEDEEFGLLSAEAGTPAELSRSLIDLALERETDDNISVVVVQVNRLPHGAQAGQPAGNGWTSALRRLIPAGLPAFFNRNRAEDGQ